MVKLENFKSVNGVKIPPYFLCPLSLDLMVDPVIVASGQTYEKSSIQKWLDQGLSICPKTCQKLSHRNLIPNHTVKALIANWCQENNIKLPNSSECSEVSSSDNGHCHSQNRNSSLGSSTGVANDPEKKIYCSLGLPREEVNVNHPMEAEKSGNSPTHSYVHSRSESTSSAVSSIDYLPSVSPDVSRLSSNNDNGSGMSAEMVIRCSPVISTENNGCLPLTGRLHHNSKTISEMAVNGNHSPPGSVSLSSQSQFDDLTTTSYVEKLLSDLKTATAELQSAAAAELRFLAKHNNDNRVIIGNCGAIEPLISLLLSDVKPIQEHAVTALLNLSINENLKAKIAEGGALEPLIHVLRTGNNVAKENAAACLFSLSVLEDYRAKIGRSAAVKGLVDLLGTGTMRGKKDAATALFNLSIFHENKARIVQAGAVKYLVELLDPEREMVDKAVALLANLSTIPEGCSAIAREGGIPMLVELVEIGSQRGKENSASILLQLCINSPKYCRLVLQEGAVPPLVALSQSGTPRAKEKAQQLLSHFRSQREGAIGRGKP
ncbi:OLC1v1007017C2 [Oldenlandia corymbosa var. corymbosa]|nr:OLC1v1007017C2 [Oldenlandia corymbosa var. corymbosa]